MRVREAILFIALLLGAAGTLRAQSVTPKAGERIFVKAGVAEVGVLNRARVDLGKMTPDSLWRYTAAIDSLRRDGVRFDRLRADSIVTSLIDRSSPTGDTLSIEDEATLVAKRKKLTLNSATVRRFMDDRGFTERYIDGGADTLIGHFAPLDTLSKRDRRRLARADAPPWRHRGIFRDSVNLSPMVALAAIAPGFGQVYNRQYWKIPVLYATVGAGLGLWAWQTSLYKPYRALYDSHLRHDIEPGHPDYERYKATMTELQGNMIRHNTYRQLALGFSIASYLYFLVDGTVNYPGRASDIKKATTLAMVCPGAGQVYNKSYWKIPIVLGGAATLIYCVDWNNRGYQRFKRALDDRANDRVVEAALRGLSDSDLENVRGSYRRNRDLCLILTGLFYIVQVVDAHSTAHMKTYDVSDDLTRLRLEPMMDSFYSHTIGGNVQTFGLSLNLRF